MMNKHKYQKGVSSRLRGSDAQTTGGKGCADLRNRLQLVFEECKEHTKYNVIISVHSVNSDNPINQDICT